MAGWETSEIKWVYPIHGYPELSQAKDSPPALVECQARDRMEERLEVTLSGVVPAAGGPKRGVRTRAVTPKNQEPPKSPDGVLVGESKDRTIDKLNIFIHTQSTAFETEGNMQSVRGKQTIKLLLFAFSLSALRGCLKPYKVYSYFLLISIFSAMYRTIK